MASRDSDNDDIEFVSPIKEFEPNLNHLASLISMGIERNKAIKALKAVSNSSLDAAIAYIFDALQGEDPLDTSSSEDESTMSKKLSEEMQIKGHSMMRIKMVFVVNTSLKMNVGKVAAQVAHAAVDLFQMSNIKEQTKNLVWQQSGQTKIVLAGSDLTELKLLENLAKNAGLISSLISDAGKTEVEPGSITCLGIFGLSDKIDQITGHLKLLKE